MKILWMTWKDPSHPKAGGAEVVQKELIDRLITEGHEVIILTASYKGAAPKEDVDGRTIIRGGNRVTVYYFAWQYYRKHLRGWADLVIDEMNTIPFFAKYYVSERHVVFVHQLAREIWFYEMPPIIGWVGFILEPLYVRMLSGQEAITVSESTRQDLLRHGFKPDEVSIISEGIAIEPVRSLEHVESFDDPTILVHGSLRSMKRTMDAVKAFEIAKAAVPRLKMILTGSASGTYGKKVMDYIKQSPHKDSIACHGRVSEQEKINFMRKSHAILVASVREGWGLIVTEANSQGTPAVVYDVPGLRDSVKDNKTGRVTATDPESLATGVIDLFADEEHYKYLQRRAYDWSKTITFERSYKDFKEALSI